MADNFLELPTDRTRTKILLIVVALGAVVFAWLAVRWQFGSMLAELTPVGDPHAGEIAELAESLASRDPQVKWLQAAAERQSFSQASIDRSIGLLEEAVRLSPRDFRLWIELGRAYEQAERAEDAETALRKAIDLAPNYTFPRWQFGNFLLRQGRTEEAFAELRRTTEQSISYREQVFSLAWDYFDRDPQKLIEITADRPDARVTLASFFAQRGRPAEALSVWNQLTDEQKAPHQAIARTIAQGLYDRKFYRQALEFARQTGIDTGAEFEKISNPGFEEHLGPSDQTLFGWRVDRVGKLDAVSDSSVRTEGARGMKLSFRNYLRPDLYNVRQVVAVEPGGKYRLDFKMRTEELKSGGPPLVRVTAGEQNTVIAASSPFPVGTNEWRPISLEFIVPADADGIEIATVRAFCGEECPIVGIVWYDDFQLSKL